jgi:hypothetical protein
MLNITPTQKYWIMSIEDKELSDLFSNIRTECLQQLNSADVNLDKGSQVQHQVAALHRIEKSFIKARQEFAKEELDKQER